MIPRVLEPEVMDTAEDARDYDAMDHAAVNAKFAADFLSVYDSVGMVLDVGTGTGQIPIELCRQHASIFIVAADLSAEMLRLAEASVRAAGFNSRIQFTAMDACGLYYHPGAFHAVISNSTIHHLPEPKRCFESMLNVCRHQIFVRDLLRPDSISELHRLVDLYAGNANARQRQLFADSLHAALTLDEVRDLVTSLGFAAETVQATSDRHWTWSAVVSL